MTKKETFEYSEYNLLQVTMCTDLYTIHRKEGEGDDFTYELSGIGVARVTTEIRERTAPGRNSILLETIKEPNVVVGLDLQDGEFNICDRDSNYVGIFSKSDKRVQELLKSQE